jgi:glycosyltransferase involved in cell wall biosynthesis
MASALIQLRAGDKALVVTTPPNIPFVVAFACLIKGASYTLLIHDSYPTALVAAGKSSPSSILVKTWRFCNRWLFKHASKIIVLGRDMKQLTENETGGLDIPVVYIPNWAELDLVHPRPREQSQLLQELNLEDRFVFLYAGNIGFTNDVETIIECASRLRDNASVHFIFLGDGSKKKYLTEEVRRRGLANVSLLQPRPRSEQPEFLNACDVAIVSLVKGTFGVSVPSRIYNVLAAGKPILGIAESESELDTVIKEDDIGWSVPPGDVGKLSTTISEIIENRNLLGPMGKRARGVAERKYNLNEIISRYMQHLTNDETVNANHPTA